MAPIKGYKQNGLKLLRRKVALRGLRAIDWRSAGAKVALEWRDEFVAALGTEENLSTQKRTLVDYAMRTRFFLDHIDGFLFGEECFIFRGKKSAWPLLMQRMALGRHWNGHWVLWVWSGRRRNSQGWKNICGRRTRKHHPWT